MVNGSQASSGGKPYRKADSLAWALESSELNRNLFEDCFWDRCCLLDRLALKSMSEISCGEEIHSAPKPIAVSCCARSEVATISLEPE